MSIGAATGSVTLSGFKFTASIAAAVAIVIVPCQIIELKRIVRSLYTLSLSIPRALQTAMLASDSAKSLRRNRHSFKTFDRIARISACNTESDK